MKTFDFTFPTSNSHVKAYDEIKRHVNGWRVYGWTLLIVSYRKRGFFHQFYKNAKLCFAKLIREKFKGRHRLVGYKFTFTGDKSTARYQPTQVYL